MSKKAENLLNVDVCATTNWSQPASAYFTFVNATGAPVTVSQNGSNNPFPFVVPGGATSFSVPVGQFAARLISKPNTYTYNTGPCPTEGNPKTVVIT